MIIKNWILLLNVREGKVTKRENMIFCYEQMLMNTVKDV